MDQADKDREVRLAMLAALRERFDTQLAALKADEAAAVSPAERLGLSTRLAQLGLLGKRILEQSRLEFRDLASEAPAVPLTSELPSPTGANADPLTGLHLYRETGT